MKIFTLLFLTFLAAKGVHAGDDLDSLNVNDKIKQKAQTMDPHNVTYASENRTANLYRSFEFSIGYGPAFNTDSYLNTTALGFTSDFHINPQWGLTARYYTFQNSLTAQGQARYNDLNDQGSNYSVPVIDAPQSEMMAAITFAPLYGKIAVLDAKIIQFDWYFLAGGGQEQMQSGPSSMWTAGTGFAFWFSKHFDIKLESRWETYTERDYTGDRAINPILTILSIGFLI